MTKLERELASALAAVVGCLENWIEIADEEDKRDYDQLALKKAYKVQRKIKAL